jgi:hypothetical protein
MAMAAQSIVAEKLTITGSVGVVTAKFNLKELYRRIGFAKETISRGRYPPFPLHHFNSLQIDVTLISAGCAQFDDAFLI